MKGAMHIAEVVTQRTVRNLYGHSSVLDIWSRDVDNVYYNLEIQNKDVDDHVRRTRFIQSQIDTKVFPKGKKYREMPDLCLIFLTQNDFLKTGQWKTEVFRSLLGTDGQYISNGVREIYINLECEPEDETAKRLLQFFKNTNDPEIDTSGFEQLAARVKLLKEEEGGKMHMCEIMEMLVAMGKEQGEAIGLAKGEEIGQKRGQVRGETLHTIKTVLRLSVEKSMTVKEIRDLTGEEESLIDQILFAYGQVGSREPERVYECMRF